MPIDRSNQGSNVTPHRTPVYGRRTNRSGNPTPPEHDETKKQKSDQGGQASNFSPISFGYEDRSGQTQHSLSDFDIERIVKAVQRELQSQLQSQVEAAVEAALTKVVDDKIKPMEERIETLEQENRNLKEKVDDIEQYSRRSLIRIFGIPETTGENTTEIVQKVIKDIDPNYKGDEVENAHRNGNPKNPRHIIVRLQNPIIKRRILKCCKNLKDHESYDNIYISEDLTRTRNKLYYCARQLCREKLFKQTWTINGKIFLKDNNEKVYGITSPGEFTSIVNKYDPNFKILW